MSAGAAKSTGTTITFGTSGWQQQIIGIEHNGASRASIPVPHFGTAQFTGTGWGNVPKLAGKIVDAGQLTIQFRLNPDTDPPLGEDAEEITIQFPPTGGDTTGAKWVFTGFMVGLEHSFPFETEDDSMSGTATIEISEDVTITAGA